MAVEAELRLYEEIHAIECDVCRDVLGACLSLKTLHRFNRKNSEAA
jgi:hypothetical protein